jgi:anti-sigma regulatory factor (Ser/Thr protein kinase)
MTNGLLEIGAVARELGINPNTLRTWERRYRSIIPHRGDRGQRLYDSDQIATLRRIQAQVCRGSRAGAAHRNALSPPPIRVSRVTLEASPTAPMKARRAVDALLEDRDTTEFAFYLRLVASELVNNAVLHGTTGHPIEVELQLFQDWADLIVQNGGARLSMKRLRRRRRHEGRGLEIIDVLAEAWSIHTGSFGTRITVRLPIERQA